MTIILSKYLQSQVNINKCFEALWNHSSLKNFVKIECDLSNHVYEYAGNDH